MTANALTTNVKIGDPLPATLNETRAALNGSLTISDAQAGWARVIVHGATATTPRDTSALVLWVGSVTPSNAAAGDLWLDTSTVAAAVTGPPAVAAVGATMRRKDPTGWHGLAPDAAAVAAAGSAGGSGLSASAYNALPAAGPVDPTDQVALLQASGLTRAAVSALLANYATLDQLASASNTAGAAGPAGPVYVQWKQDASGTPLGNGEAFTFGAGSYTVKAFFLTSPTAAGIAYLADLQVTPELSSTPTTLGTARLSTGQTHSPVIGPFSTVIGAFDRLAPVLSSGSALGVPAAASNLYTGLGGATADTKFVIPVPTGAKPGHKLDALVSTGVDASGFTGGLGAWVVEKSTMAAASPPIWLHRLTRIATVDASTSQADGATVTINASKTSAVVVVSSPNVDPTSPTPQSVDTIDPGTNLAFGATATAPAGSTSAVNGLALYVVAGRLSSAGAAGGAGVAWAAGPTALTSAVSGAASGNNAFVSVAAAAITQGGAVPAAGATVSYTATLTGTTSNAPTRVNTQTLVHASGTGVTAGMRAVAVLQAA